MDNKNNLDRSCEEYRGLFSKYMAKGHRGLTNAEARALSEGSATGGSVLFPTTYSNQFMEILGDDEVLARTTKVYSSTGVFSVPVISGNDQWPSIGGFSTQNNPGEGNSLLDATAGSQTQVTVPTIANPRSNNTLNGTTTSTLTLRRISVMVKVSQELLEDSASRGDASVEQMIVQQASQDISAALNKQILIGNATPSSVVSGDATNAGTDSCHGVVNTCRNHGRVAIAGSGSGGISGEGRNATIDPRVYSGFVRANRLAPQYWKRSLIVFNSQMTGSSTTNYGRTLFSTTSPGPAFYAMSAPRVLFGQPWTMCDMATSAQGNSIPSALDAHFVACDFSRYMLAFSSNGLGITRLNETFADSNTVAFVVSVRAAGALIDPNAAWTYLWDGTTSG